MKVVCSQYAQGEYEEESDSSDKSYTVRAFNDGEFDSCNCTAFAIFKNKQKKKNELAGLGVETPGWCKHIERVYNRVCQWDSSAKDATPQDDPGVCPECGENTVTVGIDVPAFTKAENEVEALFTIDLKLGFVDKTAALSFMFGLTGDQDDAFHTIKSALEEKYGGTFKVTVDDENELKTKLNSVVGI